MNQARIATRDWEEDHFTITLEQHLRPLAYRHPMNITVLSRNRTYTEKMKRGEESVKGAKELDLRLWGRWENYDQVHFVWEGKRVAENGANPAWKNLITEYLKEGMQRFIDEEYAVGLQDAGMLGYVLAGDCVKIVQDINTSMKRLRKGPAFSLKDHLKVALPIGTFQHKYDSCHSRTPSGTMIRLHHLFLPFDFDPET